MLRPLLPQHDPLRPQACGSSLSFFWLCLTSNLMLRPLLLQRDPLRPEARQHLVRLQRRVQDHGEQLLHSRVAPQFYLVVAMFWLSCLIRVQDHGAQPEVFCRELRVACA